MVVDIAKIRAAAEAGEARAMLELGLLLLQPPREDKAASDAKDKDKAKAEEGVTWLRKCVETTEDFKKSANPDTKKIHGSACYALGYAYDAGRGVAAVDDAIAAKWLSKAARAGNAQAKDVRSRRSAEWRRRRCLDVLILACLVIFIAVGKTLFELCYVLYYKDVFKNEVSGADPETPKYRWTRDALDAPTRHELVRRANRLIQLTTNVVDGDETNDVPTGLKETDDEASSSSSSKGGSEAAANPLSESFTHTRGVVAHFTRAALEDPHAFESDELKWIKDMYLSKVLDDHCNAFVFNVLVVPPGRWENRSVGVDFHVDQTLIQSTTQREQSAYTVSVGYVQVPPLIDGGHLMIAGAGRLAPDEGSVLVFRGDQSHGVAAFCATNDASEYPALVAGADCDLDVNDDSLQRISFVLEQYDLPPYKFKRSPSFILAPSNFEQELLPILSAFPLGTYLVELWLAVRKRYFFDRLLKRQAGVTEPVSPL